MSTFPPLSETFVMREIRQLRTEGWDLKIATLRPLHKTPAAQGFEDLAPHVDSAKWISVDLFSGFFFFLISRPLRILICLALVCRSLARPRQTLKMLYILLSASRLAFKYRSSHVELVRASFLNTEALAARFISTILQVPYTVTVYTVFAHYPRSIVENLIRNASFLIADTNRAKEFLVSLGANPALISVVHNSVDTCQFPSRLPTQPQLPPIVLGVGRLDPKKGFDVLISACSSLKKLGVKFQCVILGSGQEQAKLTALRHDLNLEDDVLLLGKASFEEIKNWYYRATVFAMTSVVTQEGDTDGLPTVVVEAMASSLPVVGTNVGGIPEAVRDGVNGFLVPPNEPEILACRLKDLLEKQDLQERFGRESRQIVESQFDLKRKGQRLSAIIRENLHLHISPAALLVN